MIIKRVWLIAAAFLSLAAMAAPASADAVFTLNCSDVACGSIGNYGTVTLKDLGSGSSAPISLMLSIYAEPWLNLF